jgi:alkanesulfonate monooxygenase SsuD/methylene tetrahydromethanopterin reductase-like flavin-dependent oxidoreductase (luciferase family)
VTAPRLTVRVGVGWSPLDRDGLGTPRFLAAIEELDELGYDSIWLGETATGPGAEPLPYWQPSRREPDG